MTETEELQKNTHKQLVLQRLDDIGVYLDLLLTQIEERYRWYLRCGLLEKATLLGYITALAVCIFMDSSDSIRRIGLNLEFTLVVISIARGWSAHSSWMHKEGEWDGAIKILGFIGMLPNKPDPREKKSKRVWSEGADMVRGWFKQKEKAKEEAYAPA